jgi:hypothetical protein
MDSDILREVRPSDDLVPSLDPTLLKLSDDEHAFLRAAISDDEDILRERVLRIQKEWAHFFVQARSDLYSQSLVRFKP